MVFDPRKKLLMPSCGIFFLKQWLHVKIRRTGEAGAYRWSIRNCYRDICSPSFEMWGRKCQLFRLKRGGSIQYGLENEEGDSPIHLSKRYVCIQQILKGTHSHVCLCQLLIANNSCPIHTLTLDTRTCPIPEMYIILCKP